MSELSIIADKLAGTGDHMERVHFANGRGVSIVRHAHSYGGPSGYFEVAVLDANGDLDYSTPVTGDVLGYQDVPEVLKTMQAVSELPAAITR